MLSAGSDRLSPQNLGPGAWRQQGTFRIPGAGHERVWGSRRHDGRWKVSKRTRVSRQHHVKRLLCGRKVMHQSVIEI